MREDRKFLSYPHLGGEYLGTKGAYFHSFPESPPHGIRIIGINLLRRCHGKAVCPLNQKKKDGP